MQWVYREIDLDTGKPTGRYGVAVASSLVDMFWNLDEELDPNTIEYVPLDDHFIVSWNMNEEKEDDEVEGILVTADDPALLLSEHITGAIGFAKKWKRPKWPSDKEIYSAPLRLSK